MLKASVQKYNVFIDFLYLSLNDTIVDVFHHSNLHFQVQNIFLCICNKNCAMTGYPSKFASTHTAPSCGVAHDQGK